MARKHHRRKRQHRQSYAGGHETRDEAPAAVSQSASHRDSHEPNDQPGSAQQSPRAVKYNVAGIVTGQSEDSLADASSSPRRGPSLQPLSRAASSASWFTPVRAADSDGYEVLLEGLSGTELRTATLVVQALRAPEDLSRLRRLAVTHGFVNDRIRAIVWPRLLGIDTLPGGILTLKLAQHMSLPPHQIPSSPAAAPPHSPAPGADSGQGVGSGANKGTEGRTTLSSAEQSSPLPRSGISLSRGRTDNASGLHDPQQLGTTAATASPSAPSSPPQPPSPAPSSQAPCGSMGTSRRASGDDSSRCGQAGGSCRCWATLPPDGHNGNGSSPRAESLRNLPDRSHPGPGGGGSGAHTGVDGGDSDGAAAAGGSQDCGSGDGDGGGEGSGPGAASSRDEPEHDRQEQQEREGERQQDWDWDWGRYVAWSQQPHRDSSVVEVDVARSLWAFTRGLPDEERERRRVQLKRLLNAVVGAQGGDVCYYQGMHDVAGVLLMSMAVPPALPSSSSAPACAATSPARDRWRAKSESHLTRITNLAGSAAAAHTNAPASAFSAPSCGDDSTTNTAAASAAGELVAFTMLRRLATTHLRDATRPTLEPVVQLLGFVPLLVSSADPALGRHLMSLSLQPFFALSWFLTWWAHELDALPPAARLFDFLLASHPLMPLYVGAVAMRSQRAVLLDCGEMPELHSALSNLKLVPPGQGQGHGLQRYQRSSSGGAGRGGRAEALLPLDEVLRQAEALWRAKPPHALLLAAQRPTRGSLAPAALPGVGGGALRQRRGGAAGRRDRDGGGDDDGGGALVLSACVAHAARMDGAPGLWLVPAEPPAGWPGPDVLGQGGRSGLARMLGLAGRSRGALLSTALLAGVYVAAAVAIGYATLSRTAEGGGQH